MRKLIFFISMLVLPIIAWSEPRLVAIKGFGSVEVEADTIEMSFSVANTNYKNVDEAKQDVEKRSGNIVVALIKLGISEADIVSPHFEVDVERNYRDRECPDSWVPEVTRYMDLTLKDISKYGRVLDVLVKNGVTRVESVEPGILDSKTYEKKALTVAIENAKVQAKFLAESFGARLGKIHNIGERKYRNNSNLEEVVVSGIRASLPERDDMPYEFKPGKVEIEADIYVEFELE